VSFSGDGNEELRQTIVSGELLPGERLLEEEPSKQLGLGRAAVRMAPVRLEHDGLVECERRAIVEEMRQRREHRDLLGVSDANARLHGRILDISGHETAKHLSQLLISQIVRFQYRTVLLPGRAEGSFAEHAEIVDAIAAHDPDAAERAMRRHLSCVAEALCAQGAPDARERVG
jgi:DNA-binding GntR family transcriptional regulator